MTTVADVNGHGVDMSLISVGAVLRFDSGPAERGRVVRMDLPRLGVVETIESAVLALGDRVIFHGLNVTAIEPAEGTTAPPKASESDPDVHNSTESGCDACGTCMAHDGCADPDNPHNGPRGDCAECGACGDCVRACAEQRARDTALNPPGVGRD